MAMLELEKMMLEKTTEYLGMDSDLYQDQLGWDNFNINFYIFVCDN